jgi:hypothetical protein
MICDDALGGSTSVHSRKFADEFIKRRQAEMNGVVYQSPVGDTFAARSPVANTNSEDQGWTSVGNGTVRPVQAQQTTPNIASENKFVVVGKTGKKKKNKK